MSAWKEMMTQEEAMNMNNEQAIQILIPMRNMMCDQNGCPISDAVFALDKAIESLSADVAPVRHERWVTTDENIGGHCSNCGMECSSVEWGDDYLMKPTWNYCPNCGARMDEEVDDE